MEALTETIKIKTIDGKDREVQIRKLLPFRKKQQIITKLFEGMNLKAGQKLEDVDINAAQAMNIFEHLAEALWADKNVNLDDVEGDSLYPALTERFNKFLGKLGFESKNSDNPSGKSGEDKQSDSKPIGAAVPTDPDGSNS